MPIDGARGIDWDIYFFVSIYVGTHDYYFKINIHVKGAANLDKVSPIYKMQNFYYA